ncbi:class I SAM-dependent methyltransferase [Lentzea nigeriaca]|uniref:class I SAM-dependent methyltransferase n=1 Tax=Lentzea nigeriaca TaxID=1128665 RepID=UPI00195A8CCC|nr:class I SAM-dependent methyltransferase [Lentzea nigeriaca]MBM7863871.1 SAM-dependent methyltransferase [Lentzea nigeriaca]
MTSAEHFDRWYAERVESPAADELVWRMLGLPPGLQSTSLLGGAGLDEVVAILDPRPGQVLLDLACGRGGYGLEIAGRTGCRLIGVDFSAVAISQAKRRADADFRVGTMTATGLSPASVDAVLVVDAIQFAEPTLDALRECLRVLRPGGRLVLTTWEALDPADERLPARMRQLDLASQLPEAGFVDVEVTEKPDWQAIEKRFWLESLALDAGDDLAIQSMQDEARRVLAASDGRRRVLARAVAPLPDEESSQPG